MESELVSRLLALALEGPLLDLGTGTGRLLPIVARHSPQVVALDLDRHVLEAAKVRSGRDGPWELLRADARTTPFRSGVFAVVVLVRAIHRFPRPELLLGEIARILRPGGHLLLSHHPRPSAKTLEYDIWSHLKGGGGPTSVTFGATYGSPAGGAGFVSTRAEMLTLLRRAGFEPLRSIGCGWEDLPVFRRLPAKFFLRLPQVLPGFRTYPTWFELLRGPSDHDRQTPGPDGPHPSGAS